MSSVLWYACSNIWSKAFVDVTKSSLTRHWYLDWRNEEYYIRLPSMFIDMSGDN